MSGSLSDVVDGRSMAEWTSDLFDQSSPDVRERAVRVLVAGDAAVARLVLRGVDPIWTGDVEAAQRAVLVGIGAAAVTPIVAELDRMTAWEGFLVPTLVAIGPPAVRPLWESALDRGKSGYARGRALKALAAMRPLPDRVNELLAEVMRDATEPDDLRTDAVVCIASWDRAYVEADPACAELLHASEARDRSIAADMEATLTTVGVAPAEEPCRPPEHLAAPPMSPRAMMVADAVSLQQPLRVRCDSCLSECVAAGRPIPEKTVLVVTPEIARAAARYCPTCGNISCAMCAGTLTSPGSPAGGRCPRCFGETVPADVSHLGGGATTVIGPA